MVTRSHPSSAEGHLATSLSSSIGTCPRESGGQAGRRSRDDVLEGCGTAAGSVSCTCIETLDRKQPAETYSGGPVLVWSSF